MTQHFSASQLRAARGLLDWTRAKLAELSGVSEPTLHRIETGAVQPHEKSIAKIIRAFEDNGVEFMNDGGVHPKLQTVDILLGRKGLQQFFNNVHEHAQRHGGSIMMFGIDETTFIDTIGNDFSQSYLKRMAEVSLVRGDLEVLAIVCEGDTNFCASAYNEYRWISKDVFQAVPFYIYGETLAIMDFQTIPSPTIIVHKFPAITNAYRKQFKVFWKMAREPGLLQSAKPFRAKPAKTVQKK